MVAIIICLYKPFATPWCCSRFSSRLSLGERIVLAAIKNQHENSNGQHCEYPGCLNHARNQQSIFSGDRIVVIAEEQHLIDRSADLPLRSFDQAQAQIARSVLNPVKVARNLSFGRQ